jgi:alkanesulfonate monooxygenase SsuD/methylene tetrahydromethanopterin reductase-like flavin-dependent oxidoreductase (luciferase family)
VTHIAFGLVMPAESKDKALRATWADDLNRVLTIASGHFESAWVVDHLMGEDEDVLEGFTTLSYMMGQHPTLKFGHAVLCQSFRNPALVAKMGATLQLLSRGRFILGIGAGWHEAEYRAYGYDFPGDGVRVKQLDEALHIIRALWTQEKVTFEGKHYRVADARCAPTPDPLPPIMVGAFRPKMLRLAAQHADMWNVSSTGIVEYHGMVAQFEKACSEIGRDAADVKRSWIGGCAVAATGAEAVALTEGRWSADDPEDFGFVGRPQQVIGQMQAFIDAGVDTFMLDCGRFPGTTTLETVIREVIPGLRNR